MNQSSDYVPSTNFSLLLLGRPKSGKTKLALEFPKPLYVADLDNNLSGPVRYFRDNGGNIPFSYDTIPIKDGKPVDIDLQYTRFISCINAAKKDNQFKTIVVDGCSALNEMIVAEVCRSQSIAESKTIKVPRIQDWLQIANGWRKIIATIRANFHNVIFTAHLKLEKNELDGSLLQHVLIQGSAKDFIAGLFSDCWLTFLDNAKAGEKAPFKIRTKQDRRIFDVGSSFSLPDVMDSDYNKYIKPILEPKDD